MRRLLGAVVGGVVSALALATPAWAHGADAPDATDYRTEVVAVSPALAGVTVRTVEAGARLELTNRSAATVEVLGYDGEPYLSVRPDGVHENVHSPAVYLNATLDGSAALPPAADSTLPPEWRRVSDAPVARWHDARSHWMSAQRPPAVAAHPGREHRIRDWVVPLRVDTTTAEVRGTLDWVPPPSPWLWWGLVAAASVAIGALGLAPRGALPTLAGLLAAGGVAALAYAVAREVDAGAVGVGDVLRGLLLGQVLPVLVALAALVAAGYAVRRRPAADFALALAGACLAVFAGVTNAAVFTRSVLPAPGPPTLARAAVALVLAAAAGVAAAGALRMRAAARAAAKAQAAPTPEH